MAQQNVCYDKFFAQKTNDLKTKGSLPDPAVTEEHGGFIIALRHHPQAECGARAISHALAELAPLMPYSIDGVHTTALVYGVGSKRRLEHDQVNDNGILDCLSKSARSACNAIMTESGLVATIAFGEYMANQTTVIAKGVPDFACADLVQRIVAKVADTGLDVKIPWGSQITLGRFTEAVPPETLDEFFRFLTGTPEIGTPPPLGRTLIVGIDVGWFTLSPEGFTLRVFNRIKIH